VKGVASLLSELIGFAGFSMSQRRTQCYPLKKIAEAEKIDVPAKTAECLTIPNTVAPKDVAA
jgi:hypothetical protein